MRVHEHEVLAEFQGDLIIERVFVKEHPALVLFTDDHSEDLEIIKTVKSISTEDRVNTKKHLVFIRSKISEGHGLRLAEYMGVSKEHDPSIWIFRPSHTDFEKYQFEGKPTKAEIKEFINMWREDKLVRHYRS